MKYIVTGGAGFIGSNLVDKLIESNHEVIIIDDLSLGKKRNINNRGPRVEASRPLASPSGHGTTRRSCRGSCGATRS